MGKSSVKSLELELEHQLTMMRFCLVIFLAIYAFGLAASDPEREEGLGSLSNKVRPLIPRAFAPMQRANCKPSNSGLDSQCSKNDECCSKMCQYYGWILHRDQNNKVKIKFDHKYKECQKISIKKLIKKHIKDGNVRPYIRK